MFKFLILISFLILGCVQIQTHHREQSIEDQLTSQIAVSSDSSEQQLKFLENKLKGRHEIDQYSQALPYFYNTSEKISFLNLPDFKTRSQWLMDQKFWDRIVQKEQQFQEVVKAQDLAIGMTEDLVRRSWGEPLEVYASGMSAFRNIRWVYIKPHSTQEGYRQQKRLVYFEGGQVTGWDIQ